MHREKVDDNINSLSLYLVCHIFYDGLLKFVSFDTPLEGLYYTYIFLFFRNIAL